MDDKERKLLAEGKVTTMSYDLETTHDININQEIKEYLQSRGWNFTIPEQRVKKYSIGINQENNKKTPNTTAWKAGVTPKEAISEFSSAIESYNVNHTDASTKLFGRGEALAVCDNEYESLRIE